MSELIPDWPDDAEWDVPDYLQSMYGVWTMLGRAHDVLSQVHFMTHIQVDQGDTVLFSFWTNPLDAEEEAKAEAGKDFINAHEVLISAVGALRIMIESLHRKLEDMDSLPTWWTDTHHAIEDRPLDEDEMKYLWRMRNYFGEDEEGVEE